MGDLNERLDKLRTLVQTEEFLLGKGLSNEVNIRLFCYDPKDEMAVRHFVEQLTNDKTLCCNLKEYNLYHVFLEICDEKRITDRIPQQEEKKGKEFILNQLKKMANNTTYIDHMQYEPHQLGDVIMLTGVGEVFPFIRVHSLLDAMQPHFSDVPIVVMYPGSFDGRYVKLFDKLTPNPYYRAFNIV